MGAPMRQKGSWTHPGAASSLRRAEIDIVRERGPDQVSPHVASSLCVSAGWKMDGHDCAGSHLWLPFVAPINTGAPYRE